MKFIRENPTLAFGLGLPLIIAVVFLLASALPELLTAPPQYDVVFATNYSPSAEGLTIQINNHKPHAVFIGENYRYYSLPRLYVFSPSKKSVHEIPITLPLSLLPPTNDYAKNTHKITPISIPELETLKLDTSLASPDGYQLENDYSSYSSRPIFLTEFFYSSSYRNEAVLRKGGYKLPISSSENEFSGVQFIGWVLPK